jgi:hypothetical protein
MDAIHALIAGQPGGPAIEGIITDHTGTVFAASVGVRERSQADTNSERPLDDKEHLC